MALIITIIITMCVYSFWMKKCSYSVSGSKFWSLNRNQGLIARRLFPGSLCWDVWSVERQCQLIYRLYNFHVPCTDVQSHARTHHKINSLSAYLACTENQVFLTTYTLTLPATFSPTPDYPCNMQNAACDTGTLRYSYSRYSDKMLLERSN